MGSSQDGELTTAKAGRQQIRTHQPDRSVRVPKVLVAERPEAR